MGPIDEALQETLFPALFRGEEVDADFRKILGRSVKCGGLGIPEPQLSVVSVYNTSKEVRRELLGSLLVCTVINYVEHRACV